MLGLVGDKERKKKESRELRTKKRQYAYGIVRVRWTHFIF